MATCSGPRAATCLSGSSGQSITLAKSVGRQLRVPFELTRKRAVILITDLIDDPVDRRAARLQQQLGAVDAQSLDERLDAFASPELEATCEIAAAGGRLSQQVVHGEPCVKVPADPVDGSVDQGDVWVLAALLMAYLRLMHLVLYWDRFPWWYNLIVALPSGVAVLLGGRLAGRSGSAAAAQV
jgi:hypothetical protein